MELDKTHNNVMMATLQEQMDVVLLAGLNKVGNAMHLGASDNVEMAMFKDMQPNSVMMEIHSQGMAVMKIVKLKKVLNAMCQEMVEPNVIDCKLVAMVDISQSQVRNVMMAMI